MYQVNSMTPFYPFLIKSAIRLAFKAKSNRRFDWKKSLMSGHCFSCIIKQNPIRIVETFSFLHKTRSELFIYKIEGMMIDSNK